MPADVFALDVGEFGWSLCVLAPRLRHLAQQAPVIVAAPPDRHHVHADYATALLPVHPVPELSNALDGAVDGELPGPIVSALDRAQRRILPPADEWTAAEFAAIRTRVMLREKAWRSMRPERADARADVLVALRPAKRYRGLLDTRKAWPHGPALVAWLRTLDLEVAAIGGPENECPPGAIDLRGIPLAELCAVIAGAHVVVGPSSGPMHLAQLCGAAVVTWYGLDAHRDSSRVRYELLWNPFGAGCTFCPEACPDAARVARAAADRCSRAP